MIFNLKRQTVLYILLLVGFAASCFICVARFKVEARNKAVEIVLDYDEVATLAVSRGKEVGEVLAGFKNSGATAVAIGERTFGDMMDDGLIEGVSRPNYAEYFIYAGAGPVAERIMESVPDLENLEVDFAKNGTHLWFSNHVQVPPEFLRSLPLFIPKYKIVAAKDAGLDVVGRLINYDGATPEAISSIVKRTKADNVRKIVFDGDEVLGYKGAIEESADSLVENGMLFGKVEFAKQKGDAKLAATMPESTVIVHSITRSELDKLAPGEAIDRFVKAARERGVRMLFVHMYQMTAEDAIESNREYVASIAKGLAGHGYTAKSAHAFEELPVPTFLRSIVGLGVAGGLIFLVVMVFDLKRVHFIAFCCASVVICGVLPLLGAGAKAVAFLASVVFPTLAICYVSKSLSAVEKPEARPVREVVMKTAAAFSITAIGGLFVVGLLSSREAILRVNIFAGVKLAHIAPILIIALLFTLDVIWKSDTLRGQLERAKNKLMGIAKDPVLLWQVGVFSAVLVILAVMVTRSGNEAAVGVSDMELKLRNVLDKLLFVRPRTKEFVIGYPLLVVGIGYLLKGYKSWAAPALVVGAIGLVSTFNTFCHLHTPLLLSLVRVFNGALIGTVIGLVVLHFTHNLPLAFRRKDDVND